LNIIQNLEAVACVEQGSTGVKEGTFWIYIEHIFLHMHIIAKAERT